MACSHPPEERQSVYEGTANARADREFCSLCGEHIYLEKATGQRASLAAMSRVHTPEGRTRRAG